MVVQSVLRPECVPILLGPGPVADEHREATQRLLGLMAVQKEVLIIQIAGLSGREGASTVASSVARSLQHGSGRQIAHFRIAAAHETDTENTVGGVLTQTTVRKLLARGVREGLAKLAPGCDLILVESTPLLVSVESVAIGAQADGVILVAESDRSTFTELSEAQQAIERSGGQLLGVILNKRRYSIPRPIARLMGLPASRQPRRARWMTLLGVAVLLGILIWVGLTFGTGVQTPTGDPALPTPGSQPDSTEAPSSDG